MTVIRHFSESDQAALVNLFSYAGKGSPSGALWGHSASAAAIYLRPYIESEPESLFVAEADGRLVGYLAGSTGSLLPSEAERMEKAISEYGLMFRPRAVGFYIRALADSLLSKADSVETDGDFCDPRWPAHLRVNLLPEAWGTDAAYGLMSHWLDYLRQRGIPGCYLQTLIESTGAVKFFERCGFALHGPSVLLPGIRYEGKRLHQQTMVWTPDISV